MGDGNNDWRFAGFNTSGRAYNRTLAVDTPFSRQQFASQSNGNVNAASRAIPNPSGTDWAATFGRNAPSSPSGTNWGKTFGSPQTSFTAASRTSSTPAPRTNFSFSLPPSSDQSQLNISTPATDFYRNRLAESDLTKRDFETYGAGPDYGFAF